MRTVGFEPTRQITLELEASSLDHSDKSAYLFIKIFLKVYMLLTLL